MKDVKERISVIVPVYQVERYLVRCVESVRNQTYENLEIILVDDGSPDGCPAICDAYAQKDARIRVIHQPNGGLSDARNAGMALATGTYFCFIDSDDYVTLDYIESLYVLLKKQNADISVVGCRTVFDEEADTEEPWAEYPQYGYDTKDAIADMLSMEHISHEAWGKLFKAELFDSVLFPVGELYEDLAVMYRLFLRASRVACSDRPLYRYFIREGSITQRSFDMQQYVEVRWIEESMALVAERYPDLDQEIRGRRVWSYFKTLHRILSSKDRAKYRQQQDEMIHKIRQNRKGLLRSQRIHRNLKTKMISLYFGRYGYYVIQKCSDTVKQIKAGHRYTV